MAQAIPYLIAGSTALQASSQIQQGDAAERAAEFEAAQMDRNASETIAQATREAYERRREGEITESNIRAAQAASGGTTTDAGAIEQQAQARTDTDYNVLSTIYQAGRQAQGQRTQAAARRYGGQAAKKASRTRALSTALSGGAQVFQSFRRNKGPSGSGGSGGSGSSGGGSGSSGGGFRFYNNPGVR